MFKGIVDLRNVIIQNPKGQFKSIELAKFSRISGKLIHLSLLKSNTIINDITLNLSELWIANPPVAITNIDVYIDSLMLSNANKKDRDEKDHIDFIAQTAMVKIEAISINSNKSKESKKLTINYSKEFHNVSSFKNVAKQIYGDLFVYGIGENVSSLFSLLKKIPGSKPASNAMKSVNRFFKKITTGSTDATKENINAANGQQPSLDQTTIQPGGQDIGLPANK